MVLRSAQGLEMADNIQAPGLETSWIRGCRECGEEQVGRRRQGHFEYTELEKLEGYYVYIEDWDTVRPAV